MKRKSVQKLQQEGRCIKCPTHHSNTTSSKYAHRFYEIIQGLNHNVHAIVWDWFDVPDEGKSNHKMHIDASVFCGSACTRFEIDGETHFLDNNTRRHPLDEYKDYIMGQCGVCMVRLHYMDVESWEDYVSVAVETQVQTVRYTASYMECLDPEEYVHIIKL
jgi:hypothetical protein